jgi:hypothetical protein
MWSALRKVVHLWLRASTSPPFDIFTGWYSAEQLTCKYLSGYRKTCVQCGKLYHRKLWNVMHHEESSYGVRCHGMASLGTTCRDCGGPGSGKVDDELDNKTWIYHIPTLYLAHNIKSKSLCSLLGACTPGNGNTWVQVTEHFSFLCSYFLLFYFLWQTNKIFPICGKFNFLHSLFASDLKYSLVLNTSELYIVIYHRFDFVWNVCTRFECI